MAASLRFDPWAPPRPFPIHAWLAERFPFRVPHPQPPRRSRSLDSEERREVELRLLVSALPLWLQALLLPTLRWEAKRRAPWGQDRCAAGSALMAGRHFPESSLASDGAALLRSLLVSECEIGLTTVQTSLDWLSRPERNHALALRAARLGQVVEALERSPEAEPLEQEAERAMPLCAADELLRLSGNSLAWTAAGIHPILAGLPYKGQSIVYRRKGV